VFQGTIPMEMRSLILECSRAWPREQGAWIGCSGNVTIERVLASDGWQVNGNDISIYTCMLGAWFSKRAVDLTPREDVFREHELDWLLPYCDGGAGTVATVLLGTRFLAWAGKTQPYYRRMVEGTRRQWDRMFDGTRTKVEGHALRLASFTPDDVLAYMADLVPRDAPFASFPSFYCLEQSERVLTADLRWVPVGDVREGDELLAFDETPRPGSRMRRWAYSTVLRSDPAMAPCVRVHLSDGSSVVTTANHPWLAQRPGGGGLRWIRSDQLTKGKVPWDVVRLLTPWEEERSWEGGWLAGMLDGEGTIFLGNETTAMSVAQKPGPIAEAVQRRLKALGYGTGARLNATSGVLYMSIDGGLPTHLEILGRLRAERIIARLRTLDMSRRTIRQVGDNRVRVLSVEPVGDRPIQQLQTSTGTYIGEGFAHHNSTGYTTMWKPIDEHFTWPAPDVPEIDETGKTRMLEMAMDRPHWIIGVREEIPELAEYKRGWVQVTPRAMPFNVYASGTTTRVVTPRQPMSPLLVAKLGPDEELTGDLALHRISQAEFNGLRALYLNKGIAPGAPPYPVAVTCGGKLVGAFCYDRPKFDPDCAYLMSDFPVHSDRYRRLAKLIVMAAMSSEAKTLMERSFSRRIRAVGSTAFTNNPQSSKYGRGIPGMRMMNRRKADDGVHEWLINYTGPVGQWDLPGALDLWTRKHASDQRQHAEATS
jgi:hypothetical protein